MCESSPPKRRLRVAFKAVELNIPIQIRLPYPPSPVALTRKEHLHERRIQVGYSGPNRLANVVMRFRAQVLKINQKMRNG